MNKNDDWIVVGRFGRVHGVKGFITVHSFTEPRDNIFKYGDWRVCINKTWQPLEILKAEIQSKSIIVLIKGYEQREIASRLTNAEIAVSRANLPEPEPGEYYWHDLIGMSVMNLTGESFGTVVDIMPTGANDVLVVRGEKKHLIPYLPEQVIKTVDMDQKKITIDWDLDF